MSDVNELRALFAELSEGMAVLAAKVESQDVMRAQMAELLAAMREQKAPEVTFNAPQASPAEVKVDVHTPPLPQACDFEVTTQGPDGRSIKTLIRRVVPTGGVA